MKKRLLALPLLTLALVLTGCKTKPADSSSSSEVPSESTPASSSDIPSESTGSSEHVDPVISDAEKMLIDFGYIKVNSWPTTPISSFLRDNGVSESVPTLSTKTPLFYDIYGDEESGAVIFEIAILDVTDSSLNSAYAILEDKGWELYYEEDLYFDFDSPLGEIILSGEVYEGDDTYPEATYLYITVAGGEDGGGDGSDPVGSEAEEMLLDFGYLKVNSWPTAVISSFLTDNGVSESIPALSTKTPLFYDIYEEENGAVTFEIAILDATDSSLNSAYAILEVKGWELYYEEDLYFDFDSPLGELVLSGEVYEGDDTFPEATYLYITVPVGEDGDGDGGEYEATIGWPEDFVNDYLDFYEVTSSVPKLDVTGEVLYATFNDDFYFNTFYEYISLFIIDENVVESYGALLTAAGYLVQEDSELEDASYGYDEAGELFIDFNYYSSEEIEGTFINIIAYAAEDGNGGGEVVPPTNPDKNAIFSFLDENQIDGTKNADKTTWKSGASSFIVEKTGSGHGVGNPGGGKEFYSNPLRLYYSQTVTITAGGDDLIEQIKFDVESPNVQNGKDSIQSLTDAAPNNVTLSVLGDSITFIFATPVSSFSFQLDSTPGVQARLFSVTLYFI